ncbi:MAG: caspase family protein, partial [Methylococcaceae bacterium]|nr:caspase family protein [Methylococcaceae bacterium]
WTIVDNKGRFDSSEKGMTNISWEAEGFEIPLDNFSGSYYEPGVLASHLSDQVFINKQPQVVQQGIKLPPKPVVIIPEGDRIANKALVVKVEAQGLGGGVEDIKLYHNGKIVSADAILGNRQETVDKLIKRTLEFELFPIAGQNTFKVIAKNKMGIEGHSDEVTVDFKGKKQKSILHVLTIGINQYKDSRLNLDYSVADANGIENVFKNSKFTAYDQVVQHELRDKQATKAEILKQLNTISQATQEDVVVVYLAGHGLAIDGEWYFMPHETLLNDNQSYYEQVGVSAKEIQQIFINSKVQHFMVMIDACYSGAGINAFRKMQDVQRHFSRDLSKSVGVVVLAATRKDQQAAELIDLGHGLFTYVVSEGMKGAADLNPRNRSISAHEVADYSTDTIPTFSKKYLGASQEPTSFTMGSDFTLLRQE